MPRVLIANLGESPVVISALVHSLAVRGTPIDQLEVLYPGDPSDRWIRNGFEMLAEQLAPQLSKQVEGEPLSFVDAATEADCLVYLRALCKRLERHERAGNDVILGISGGRKHTAALMAVPALFYRCVKALVHLHDRDEHVPGSQQPAHRLYEMDREQRQQAFNPSPERFTLVELPFGRLSDGPSLRRWIGGIEQGITPPAVPLSPWAHHFYRALFGTTQSQWLEVHHEAGRPLDLIAPLGESPMVVTQTYSLLAAMGRSVAHLRVVYPHRNGAIEAGARLLIKVCHLQGVPLTLVPIEIADLSDSASVPPFMTGLRAAVAAARSEQSQHEPALLLAGGRKGMAALSLFVAQAEGIERVYHTTIPNPVLEAQVVKTYEQAARGPHKRLAEIMFLKGADPTDFALITVPVVSLQANG